MKIITSLILILIVNAQSFSLAQENTNQESETTVVEQKRNAGYFDKVVMTDGGNVFISQSSVTSLKVVTRSSCLQSVKTEVNSQVLKIYNTGNTSDCRPDIYISIPVLKEIQQDGGGNIEVREGFDTMDSLRCILNGGGSVNLAALKVESFYATIKGGGKISIYADKLLEADISGGGFISYQGNPKVISTISGGGSVKRN